MRPTPLLLLLAAVGMAGFVAPASATIVYETDFQNPPFNDANLQFQDGWLGQNFTNVDTSGDGFANTDNVTFFPRNLNNRGALGNLAGGDGSGESSGPGFNVGDKLRITAEYQFFLSGRTNAQLANVGVDDAFVTGGFNASPVIGMQFHYSDFESSTGGALKFFGSLGRNGFSGADNAFALIVPGLDIGLDPDGTVGPADIASDVVEGSIELTYLGGDDWQTTDLTLANSTTGTPLLSAAVDQPSILTEIQSVPSGNDLFLAVQWMRTAIPRSSFDSFRYEYIAVPEPSSLAMFGLVTLGLAARPRR